MIALRSKTSRRKPQVPNGIRVYAIGDIHGRVDLLDAMLKRIDSDLEQSPISMGIEVYLGDYIDRGPASREVIDRLVARNRTFRAVFLKGKHETYLTSFATNPPILEDWWFLFFFFKQKTAYEMTEVYETVREAVARARDGLGPSLIEALTYRWG